MPSTHVTAYTQSIQIKVPSTAKWEPQRVQQFINSLFTFTEPFTLSIRANNQHITWWVEVGETYVSSVQNGVYSLYPQAQMDVVPKNGIDKGYYLFQIESGRPFFAPLQSADDYKTDPLSWVVGAMAEMEEGEEIVYEVTLSPPKTNYVQLGEKLLTKSNVSKWEFTTVSGAAGAATRKAMGGDRVSKYTREIEKTAMAKLNSQLMEAILVIKVKAHSYQRAERLADAVLTATATFDNDGFGFLAIAQKETYHLVLTPGEVAALWHPPTQDITTPGVSWVSGIEAPAPVEMTRYDVEGIVLGTNTHRGRTSQIKLGDKDRNTHISVFGRTRLGKSTLFHNMLCQDIAQGKGVALIDPHGDLFEEVLASIPQHRHNDVVIFDVNDTEYPVGLNLFARQTGVRQEQVDSEIFNVIRKILGEDLSSPRMRDVMRNSIAALVEYENATIKDIPKLLNRADFRMKVLSKVTNRVTKEYWLDEFEEFSAGRKSEIAAPINSRLREFYRNREVEMIVCQRFSLDFRRIMDENKIFLARLGGLQSMEKEVLGALLISKIQMAAMSRGEIEKSQRSMYYLYIDEVQNFVTTSLPTILSEAGKYGLSLVTANQFLQQLEGDTLKAIMGNVGTTIIFGVSPDDARTLEPFVVPNVDRTLLVNQDRGETVVRMMRDGKVMNAFSMMTLPPLDILPLDKQTISGIRNQSRSRYARHRDEVDRELDERFASTGIQDSNRDDADEEENGDEFAE